MHVVINRILRRFFRGLEQRAYVHVKANIGESCGNHLGPPIMPILPHLYHQHPGAAAFLDSKRLYIFLDCGIARVACIGRTVHPGQGFHLCPMPAENHLHGQTDLAHCGARACGCDGGGKQIAV